MKRPLLWKLTDNLKRKFFLKFEIKKLILKSIRYNSYLPLTYRYLASYNYSKYRLYSSVTVQKNKCIKTGRVWSTVSGTRYSRFVFRRESYHGNLPGFKRASW